MTDRMALLATFLLTVFFLVAGLIGALDHFISKMILFIGLAVIIINIIVVKAKDKEEPE